MTAPEPRALTDEERDVLRAKAAQTGMDSVILYVERLIQRAVAAERAGWERKVEALADEWEGRVFYIDDEGEVIRRAVGYPTMIRELRALLAQTAATEPETAAERARCRHFLNGWTCADEARGRSGWDDWCEPCLAASPSAVAAPDEGERPVCGAEGIANRCDLPRGHVGPHTEHVGSLTVQFVAPTPSAAQPAAADEPPAYDVSPGAFITEWHDTAAADERGEG